MLSFFSALITLLIAAFLYSTAAGEELIAGRVAIMVLLAGLASAIAVLELFHGLTWLVRAGISERYRGDGQNQRLGDPVHHLRLLGDHGP